MKFIKKYQNPNSPISLKMNPIQETIKEHITPKATMTDGVSKYVPYTEMYPDVYEGYKATKEDGSPDSPLLLTEYTLGEDGEQYIESKKAVPYEQLSNIYVKIDPDGKQTIVTKDDIDDATYDFDYNGEIGPVITHRDTKRMPYHDTFRNYTFDTDQSGNLLDMNLIGPDDWHDPSENIANDLLAAGAGASRAIGPVTRAIGKGFEYGLKLSTPSTYLGSGIYPTVLGGTNASLAGAWADNVLLSYGLAKGWEHAANSPYWQDAIAQGVRTGLAVMPFIPFRAWKQYRNLANMINAAKSRSEKIAIIQKAYPHLNEEAASRALTEFEYYQSLPLSQRGITENMGFSPQIAEVNRWREVKDRLTKKPDPALLPVGKPGYPDTYTETPILDKDGNLIYIEMKGWDPKYPNNYLIGVKDGTRLEKVTRSDGTSEIVRVPDNSEAFIQVLPKSGIISPILRPSYEMVTTPLGSYPNFSTVPANKTRYIFSELNKLIKKPEIENWKMISDLDTDVTRVVGYSPDEVPLSEIGVLPHNTYSLDSNALMYDFARRNNLDLYELPAIYRFNPLAFKNKSLSTQFLMHQIGGLHSSEVPLFEQNLSNYAQQIGAAPPYFVMPNTQRTIIVGSHPFIRFKKGGKLIPRKK